MSENDLKLELKTISNKTLTPPHRSTELSSKSLMLSSLFTCREGQAR